MGAAEATRPARHIPGVVLPVDVAVIETPRYRQRSVAFRQTVESDCVSQSSRVVLFSRHEPRRNCQRTQLNFAYAYCCQWAHVSRKKVTPCILFHNSVKQCRTLIKLSVSSATSNCTRITKFQCIMSTPALVLIYDGFSEVTTKHKVYTI